MSGEAMSRPPAEPVLKVDSREELVYLLVGRDAVQIYKPVVMAGLATAITGLVLYQTVMPQGFTGWLVLLAAFMVTPFLAGPGAGCVRENTRRPSRYRLDEVIHTPVRLSIMSALAAADRVDFRFLRELVEVSDSLLSKHMTLLEDAGYVTVIKGYQGKRPRTWFTLTSTGRTAFDAYLAALHEIVGIGVSQPTPPVS